MLCLLFMIYFNIKKSSFQYDKQYLLLFKPFLSYCSYTEKLYYKKIYIKTPTVSCYSTIFTINSLVVGDVTDHKQNQTNIVAISLFAHFSLEHCIAIPSNIHLTIKIYLTGGHPCTLRMSTPSQPAASIPAPFYGAN